MDLENQQRVKDAAEKYGAENVVVILGSSDPEGAEIYAETVTCLLYTSFNRIGGRTL